MIRKKTFSFILISTCLSALILFNGCTAIETKPNSIYCDASKYVFDDVGNGINISGLLPIRGGSYSKEDNFILEVDYCGSNKLSASENDEIILEVDNSTIVIKCFSHSEAEPHYIDYLSPTNFSKKSKLEYSKFNSKFELSYDQLKSLVNSNIIKIIKFGELDNLRIYLTDKKIALFRNEYEKFTIDKIEKDWKIGISALTETMKILYGTNEGIYISEVSKGGKGERFGFKKNTVLVKINDTEINSENEFYNTLFNYDGKYKDYLIKNVDGTESVLMDPFNKLGIKVVDLGKEVKDIFNTQYGVYIEEVRSDGEGEKRGLEKTTIILEVNGDKILSKSELQELLQKNINRSVKILIRDKNGAEKEIDIDLSK